MPPARSRFKRLVTPGLALLLCGSGCGIHRWPPLLGGGLIEDAALPPLEPGGAPTPEDVEPAGMGGSETALAAGGARAVSLEAAIQIALERNPDVRAAAERIGEAEAHVGEATSAFLPQVSTRLSFARTDNPMQAFGMILSQRRFSPGIDFNDPGTTQNVRPEITAALPLFRGGQDHERRLAAGLGVEAAQHERLALRNAMAGAVTTAYYALALAPEQVEVTRVSIQAVESALAQAKSRFGAGAALRSDVLSLEVRLAAAREAQVRAQNAVELARAGLRVLLGLAADTPLEIAGMQETQAFERPQTFEAALGQARARRPEIAAAARLVAIREHEVRAERAAYLPRLDAVASYGNDSEDLKLSSERDSWLLGAAAELDLFSGFRTAARVRAARRRLAEARETERKTRLEVEREVTFAFLQLQEAEERVGVTSASVASADEALRLVQEQYHGGAVIVTRYLEAEAARTEARSHAIAARYDLRRAEAALKKAMAFWARQ